MIMVKLDGDEIDELKCGIKLDEETLNENYMLSEETKQYLYEEIAKYKKRLKKLGVDVK